MATVYLAHDLRHDRRVALKVLRPELAAVIGAQRFLQEIPVTANLQHPHILALFDSGEADGFLYYVMPYVEGESLRDRLNREKQLPVETERIMGEGDVRSGTKNSRGRCGSLRNGWRMHLPGSVTWLCAAKMTCLVGLRSLPRP